MSQAENAKFSPNVKGTLECCKNSFWSVKNHCPFQVLKFKDCYNTLARNRMISLVGLLTF